MTAASTPDDGSYNATVLDHFRNPRNAGELPDANAVGEERNPVCGDHMRLMLRIERAVITEARFLTKGCGAAIATSSVATDLLRGSSVAEARKLRREAARRVILRERKRAKPIKSDDVAFALRHLSAVLLIAPAAAPLPLGLGSRLNV